MTNGMPFGGFEIVGGDIHRKCGVTEFIDKDAAEEGHGALSLPRRERTPLSATGAWVVCQRFDNTAPSILAAQC